MQLTIRFKNDDQTQGTGEQKQEETAGRWIRFGFDVYPFMVLILLYHHKFTIINHWLRFHMIQETCSGADGFR